MYVFDLSSLLCANATMIMTNVGYHYERCDLRLNNIIRYDCAYQPVFKTAALDRPHTTRFLSCDESDRMRYATTGNRIGSCHLTEIGTLATDPLTLHDCVFPGVRRNNTEIYEHVRDVTAVCDSLQFIVSLPTESQRVSNYTIS